MKSKNAIQFYDKPLYPEAMSNNPIMKHMNPSMEQSKNIPRRLASILSTRKNSKSKNRKSIHLDPSFNQMSELGKSPGLPL
jgi:hypothetical protein